MNAVIPAPAARTAATPPAGVLATDGPWAVRAADSELEPVAVVVRALLEPHRRAADAAEHHGAHQTMTLRLGDAPEFPKPHGIAVGRNEAHTVTVGSDGVTCQAESAGGVFRAAVTAVQMAATADKLPYQELADAPRYAWRALMLDPARSFIPVADLLGLIDLAALYKLNVVHLHLTDNQGWRLEIPGLPELTSGDAPFYTADEYREIQAYAAARFVTVIPEIDLPGHCGALREALPHLPAAPVPDDGDELLEHLSRVIPFVPPLDLADAATMDVVRRIHTQVCAMTAGPFVHIGADEAAGMTHDGYVRAVRELRDLVRESGKQPLAWQEASRAGSGPDDITQHWFDSAAMQREESADAATRTSKIASETAAAFAAMFAPAADDLDRILDGGGKVVLSNQSHLYLDRGYVPTTAPASQADDTARLGLPFYPARTLEEMAAWDPADYGVPDDRVAGIETALWAETITGTDDLTFLLLPRLAAVAETAWTGRPADWTDYRERLAAHALIWTRLGLTFFASTEVPWAHE